MGSAKGWVALIPLLMTLDHRTWVHSWALRPRSVGPAHLAQAALCGTPCIEMETDWASPFVFLSGCGQTCLALPPNSLPFYFPKAPCSQCLSIVMALMSKSGVLLNTRQGDYLMLLSQTSVSSSERSIKGVTDIITVVPWSSKVCLFFRRHLLLPASSPEKCAARPRPRPRALYMSTVSW